MIFEIGLPRKVCNTKEEVLKIIKANNGIKNLYQTVYNFREMNGNKPNYNSANINRLFFDFDGEGCWIEAKKLHNFLYEKDIKHSLIFSGGGFHILVYTSQMIYKNPKATILNAQRYFINQLDLKCDKQVLGDCARFRRIPNTFNVRRKMFCIPLTKQQFDLGEEKIKKLAQKQNFVKEFIGKNVFDIKQFDCEIENRFEFDIKKFENNFSEEYFKNCPDVIKYFLSQENLGWEERGDLILYFKEKGFTQEEVLQILKNHLSEKKFRHCIYEERQLQYLFSRDDLVFPSKYGIELYK